MKHVWTGIGLLLVFLDVVFGAICGRRCHWCEHFTMTTTGGLCLPCREMVR